MTNHRFHVAIVGGGIGGLALAQGLKKAGVSVAVYERDRTSTDRLQGYRVHISPKGSRALHDCLPSDLFGAFAVTCGVGNHGFRFLTEKMEELLALDVPGDEASVEQHRSASRITLRQVLLSGLDGIVQFDKMFVSYDEPPHGAARGAPIVIHFSDGSTATCDVLIGADGGNSRVRRQFLPHAQRLDTGVVGIAAKAMLAEENRRRLPPRVLEGTGMVMSPGRRGMFIGLHEFGDDARGIAGEAAAPTQRSGDALFDNTTSYVFWAYGSPRADVERGRRLEELDSAALQRLVLDRIRNWHPDFSVLVCASDPSTFNVVSIKTSVPVPPWETRRITLIGDAIHSMTPYRGIGANIAIRDAALLCRNLRDAARGNCSVEAAISDYERQMRDYGFAAVRSSLKALQQSVADKGIGFRLTKLFFRAVNATPPLKRLVFADLGEE
jgi:2-polyprenyl-6-methoxyphenol hydroxylase-like FAD-dependent oxidoreductase